MSTIIPILIFLLILGVVVFVHELGHFLAARRAGVFVEEFAIGMGPILLSFRGKTEQIPVARPENAEEPADTDEVVYAYVEEHATLYSLRAFPIGGFCRMRGMEEDATAEDTRALNNKTIPQRMLVMAGGSLMNFLLAFILFFALAMMTGFLVAEVRGVQENRPAYAAGLQPGDRITHINGNRVTLYENFLLQLEFSQGEAMDVRFVRDGTRHDIVLTPFEAAPNTWRMGFIPEFHVGWIDELPDDRQRVGVWGATTNAVEMMLFNIRLPFTMLARWVSDQHLPAGAGVTGPIGMGAVVVDLVQESPSVVDTVLRMVFFTALLSTALGLFNLLPIPAMDGARLVFLGIEAVRRKPIPPERETMVHLIGFVLIIALAIFIAYRDIVRLIPS